MAPGKFNHLFLTVATLFLIAVACIPATEARKFVGINPFCLTADNKRLCNRMVEGAGNLHDATVNAMKATLVIAKRARTMVPAVAPVVAHLPAVTRDSIMSVCVEDFDGIVGDLEESIEAFNTNDIGTVQTHLSAALRTDCEDALSESGIDFPIAKFAGHLHKQVDNCLAVMMQN